MWSAKFGKDRYEYGQILKEMHTFLYEDVGSKYGLERGDSIEGRNVHHLHKRDYIRKLTKEAKQAEKAVKGLQSMMRNLESKIFSYRLQLEETEKELASGKITLDRYEAQKADIQKLIAEYQTKLEDKTDKLHAKEQMRQKHVQLFSRSATTKLISCHLKLPRKYPCSVLTNGSSGRTNVLPSSLPKLSAR